MIDSNLANSKSSLPAHFFKGVPALADRNTTLTEFAALGKSLLADELALPAAILHEEALAANERWMQAFTEASGVELCPHGKTTMSPELFARQLRNGAWGLTAATAHHVRTYAALGVRRIIMANQLIGQANIDLVLKLLRNDPELDFYCLIDSIAGINQLAQRCKAAEQPNPIKLLIEIGGPGQRAGVRTAAEAFALAQHCQTRAEVQLCGMETFEGVYAPVAKPVEPVDRLLDVMIDAAVEIDAAELFKGREILLTAGGSAFFDLAADAIAHKAFLRPTRSIIRSGCYLTHDVGIYEGSFADILRRAPELAKHGRFIPAMEVWAHVQSRPEPGRVIVALGKRDISYDVSLPIPQRLFRPGRDTKPIDVPGTPQVVALFDQHACLDVEPGDDWQIGDLVGFGLSHPCTTFDKWNALFVVDNEYRVTSAVTTLF